jgi:outer membrane protein assembly factor BamB
MSRQHHDIQRAGNPVGYHAPGQQAAAFGVTTVLGHLTRTVPAVTDRPLTDDVIYQVTPDGKLHNFTWRAADHLDEFGFDQSALMDIKGNHHYDDQRGTVDWLHVNSMSLLGRNPWYESDGDFRFAPDNILIGSREASFLAIISAKTGKVVWRLGPDLSAGKPGSGVGQLVGPHHAHMVPHGLPGAGNILVFDNGGISGYGGPKGYPRYQRGHSRVVEINPRTMSKVWEYGPTSGVKKLFSPALGSVQRLPSGNTFISSGLEGRLLEVTTAGDVTWSLQLKDKDGPMTVYRAYRVPPEWLPVGVNPAGYREWSKACRAD